MTGSEDDFFAAVHGREFVGGVEGRHEGLGGGNFCRAALVPAGYRLSLGTSERNVVLLPIEIQRQNTGCFTALTATNARGFWNVCG